MPTIKIDDLHPTGAELFSDSESYMNELGDNELNDINGGFSSILRSLAAASRSVIAGSRAGSRAVSREVRYSAQKYTPKITEYDPGKSMPGASLSGWW